MTTIELDQPIKLGEREVGVLNFQPTIVRHLMAADGKEPDSVSFVVAMASSMTGEPELLLQQLGPTDWRKVRAHVSTAWGEFTGFNRAQVATMLALELSVDEMRDVLALYAKLHKVEPVQLLPVPAGPEENPTRVARRPKG